MLDAFERKKRYQDIASDLACEGEEAAYELSSHLAAHC
jgi:hypothetical protein